MIQTADSIYKDWRIVIYVKHIFGEYPGDNCAKWLLRLGQERDVLVRMGHMMHFRDSGSDMFNIKIDNTGEVVHTQFELNYYSRIILRGRV